MYIDPELIQVFKDINTLYINAQMIVHLFEKQLTMKQEKYDYTKIFQNRFYEDIQQTDQFTMQHFLLLYALSVGY